MSPPLVKICGVTRVEDARLAVELGADLLGLNFHPPSPRFVKTGEAAEVAKAVGSGVRLVGVFVNRSAEEVEEIGEEVGLDLLQFHGDEGPEYLECFGERAIKVFRVGEDFRPEVLEDYPRAWGFLFDRYDAELYGGSGEEWPWDRVAAAAGRRPTLIAGGIAPGNARRALRKSRTAGVDVCSGVERSPGVKDPELMRELFREVRDEQG